MMKLTKLLILFLFLSIKGFSQQAVLTSSGDKVILSYLSLWGGTITGTLGVIGNTTLSGTLTLPSLSSSTLLGTNGSKGVATGNLTGDITTIGFSATLTNTTVVPGTYGSSTAVPQITVDSKGRITTITTAAIAVSDGGTGGTAHTIGESYGGGKVFYVTTDGLHGLIAETQDQSSSCTWYDAQDIISDPANHSDPGTLYIDWRLPTKFELNLLYYKKSVVGGFAGDGFYWSSTEYYETRWSWVQLFNGGFQSPTDANNTLYVRAVRAF